MENKSQQKIMRTRKGNRTLGKVKTALKRTPEKPTKPKKNQTLKDNQETANRRSVENTSPEKKRRKNVVENLHSDLSSKYIGFSADSKRNRNGKPQRSTGSEVDDVNPLFPTNVVQTELSPIQSISRNSNIETDKNLTDVGLTTSEPLAIDLKEVKTNEGTDNLRNKEQIDGNNSSLRQRSQSPSTNATHSGVKKSFSIFDTPSPKLINDTPKAKTNENEINGAQLNLRLMTISPLANSTDSVAELALPGLQASSKVSHTLMSEGSDNTDIFQQNKDKLMEADLSMRRMSKSPSATSTDSAKGSSIDIYIDDVYTAGRIYWGKIATFPYWPCIVWPDPQGRTVSSIGRNQIRVHVRFFADNGRRSWVRKALMLRYNGREDFEKQMNLALAGSNKKDANYEAFYISDKRRNLWEQAIHEAETVFKEPLEDRLAKFDIIMMESWQIVSELKRRRSQRLTRTKAASVMSEDTRSVSSDPELSLPASKRLRSLTPESPAFEEINDLKKFVKRRKMILTGENGNDAKNNEASSFAEIVERNEEASTDTDFNKFFDLMRDFVVVENGEIENKLKKCVEDIWDLRNLSKEEWNRNNNGPFPITDIKRFSNRLKTMVKEKKLPTNSRHSLKNVAKKEKKNTSKPIEEVVDDILDLNRNFLFKGLNREPVCKLCYKPSELVKCSGPCQSWLHIDCNNISAVNGVNNLKGIHVTGDIEDLETARTTGGKTVDKIMCEECKNANEEPCFVCKEINADLGERFKCHVNWCRGAYHISCLKYWPQAKLTKSSAKVEALRCPRHVCHTCVSDDPRGKFLQIDKLKLVKCVLCPATYHQDSFCIPAGTIFLTATSIKCPRHRLPDDNRAHALNLNTNWCFICTKGGNLMCCETCPTAFHKECLRMKEPEGSYICEECETGRLPLYGEIVWAKLGSYRWWPALIIPPPEVPKNLDRISHNENDFCVRFFGTNNHTWISRRRVFLYQEGDSKQINQTKGLDQSFNNGVAEAQKIYDIIKRKKQLQNNETKDKRLQPLPYIKIKSNKPVPPVKLPDIDMSASTPCDCNPSDLNPCGLNSGCLNRSLFTECNPKICPAGSKCQNQLFEKRVYPPLNVYKTATKGWGLRCEEDLMAGHFIIEYVGEVIDEKEFNRRTSQKKEEKDDNYYFFGLEKDYMIDAGSKGNLARFINHSCDPNCEIQKWTVNGVSRIGLFAIKDITAHTELTFNYNLKNIFDEKKVCHCGASKCAGFIGAKYKEPEKTKSSTVQSKQQKNRKPLKKVSQKALK